MGLVATALCVGAVGLTGCDLPQKDLGDETDGSDSGGPCEDGDTKPADDGCNTCVCENGGWSCTEIACGGSSTTGPTMCNPGDPVMVDCNECICDQNGQPSQCTEIACPGTTGGPSEPSLVICDGSEPMDPVFIQSAVINGDSLDMTVSYSGGCMTHDFIYCWDGSFAESNPVQAFTTLSHEDNDDPCDAIPSEDLSFDLTELRTQWQQQYQGQNGTIIINVPDVGGVTYTF